MIIKLYDFLQSNNVECYFVGQHKGESKSNYVVLKDHGVESLNKKVGIGRIEIIFYIPENNYTKCGPFKKEVKELIKEFKNLRYTGTETAIITDNEKKALTFSVTYEIYKKLY